MGFKRRQRIPGPSTPGSPEHHTHAGPPLLGQMADALRAYGLGLPGVHEDYPWGERVLKVRKRVFVFLGEPNRSDGKLGFSVKLPLSGQALLEMPFAEPTGYGLGRAGWVSVTCTEEAPFPLELMQQWVEESYRAIAPKKLSRQLDLPDPG